MSGSQISRLPESQRVQLPSTRTQELAEPTNERGTPAGTSTSVGGGSGSPVPPKAGSSEEPTLAHQIARIYAAEREGEARIEDARAEAKAILAEALHAAERDRAAMLDLARTEAHDEVLALEQRTEAQIRALFERAEVRASQLRAESHHRLPRAVAAVVTHMGVRHGTRPFEEAAPLHAFP
jgi:V/A-type H+/Na+-transporting ATPase subunit G/H